MIVVSEKEKKLQSIIELENKLNEIQDVDVLLERILTETRRIVNADAGSIYVVSGENAANLSIKYSQNDTQLRELPAGKNFRIFFSLFRLMKNLLPDMLPVLEKVCALQTRMIYRRNFLLNSTSRQT